MSSMFENKRLNDRWYVKSNENVAKHLQVPPQNTPFLWQLNSHKHIGSIPELLTSRTIIVMTLTLMYVQVFRLRRRSHSLLDDPRNVCTFFRQVVESAKKEIILYMFHGK